MIEGTQRFVTTEQVEAALHISAADFRALKRHIKNVPRTTIANKGRAVHEIDELIEWMKTHLSRTRLSPAGELKLREMSLTMDEIIDRQMKGLI